MKLMQSNHELVAKDYINRSNTLLPKEGVYFTDFIRQTAFKKSKRMSRGYMKSYNTIIYHLKNFEEKYLASIYTNSVNEDFLDDFIIYLQEQQLKNNYIKSIVGLIKAMAGIAGTYGYAVDPTFSDVQVDEEESFSVYLSMNEITRIYYYKGLSTKKARIRDLFIVGCLTAMRYSDYSTLIPQNFQGNYIVKITKKTNKKVVVPIHDYVREIYERYDGFVSSNLSIQHFNRYIKEICREIGINDSITYSYTRGGSLVTEVKPKYELISSHTARRSAATNMYMTGRMKTYEIMSITGHTTEKSFFRYIKVSRDDISNQLGADMFFKK